MPRDNESELTNWHAAYKEHIPDFRKAGFRRDLALNNVDAALIVMLGMTCRQFNRMDEEISEKEAPG